MQFIFVGVKLFLKPTVIYVKQFLEAARIAKIKGAAHITGGGFYDNIPRMLPKGAGAVVEKDSWSVPKVFKLIREKAAMSEEELYRTFNMGIGMVLALSRKDAVRAGKMLREKFGLRSFVIGRIVKGRRGVEMGGRFGISPYELLNPMMLARSIPTSRAVCR